MTYVNIYKLKFVKPAIYGGHVGGEIFRYLLLRFRGIYLGNNYHKKFFSLF